MLRTALDSDDLTAFTIPVDFILTYSDLVTDTERFAHAHPYATVVYIDRGLGDPGLKATVADVERGALTPADLPAWFDRREAAKLQYLTMYVNRGNLAAANAAVAPREPWRWVATLDGTMTVPGFTPMARPALVQTAHAGMTGIHADFSVVLEDAWHPRRPPAIPPAVLDDVTAALHYLSLIADEITSAQAALRTIKQLPASTQKGTRPVQGEVPSCFMGCRKRRRPCCICGIVVVRWLRTHQKAYCDDHGIAVLIETSLQMKAKSGPRYDRWKASAGPMGRPRKPRLEA